MPKQITEAGPLGAVREEKSGRLQIGLISPGWGSSGYYSSQVLENAAAAKVFPAGTQMFLDHPGETERYDRPERSVRDLAATLTNDAVWDGQQLVGEAQVFGPFVDMLTDEHFAAAIGVSIRAFADTTVGEAEGRKGTLVTALTEAVSVDFVTKAGRGGSIIAVLESARPEQVAARAVAHGVAEATANDTRDALMDAVKAAYGAEKTWVWVRDFDDETVWFDLESPDEQTVYQQGYTLADDGAVTLAAGDPVEVRARTEYVPVTQAADESAVATARRRVEEARNVGHWIESRLHLSLTQHADEMFGGGRLTRPERIALSGAIGDALTTFAASLEQSAPQLYTRDLYEEPGEAVESGPIDVPAPAGQSNTTQESEEDTMPQIEEARLRQLEEDAGRVTTLESERDTAARERDEAREALATERRTTAANRVIDAAATEAGIQFTALERRGLLTDLPVGENAALDEAAFRTSCDEAAAEIAEAQGAGGVRGFGSTRGQGGDTVTEADFDAAWGGTSEED